MATGTNEHLGNDQGRNTWADHWLGKGMQYPAQTGESAVR
jgi:hypothetical protein